MGFILSSIYNYCRRKILRYNVGDRALKFLEKEKLPPAPKHPVLSAKQKVEIDRSSLQHLHEKSEELNEYLKKVYLTSTSPIEETPSKRPKPKKENECRKNFLFYEPETPAPGQITLTKVVEVLMKTQKETNFVTPTSIANEYNLDKKDAFNLIAYYSLFRLEKFDFMNAVEKKTEEEPEVKAEEFDKVKRIASK